MINEQATNNLKNLIFSYTLQESTELLNQIFDHITERIRDAPLNDNSKEQMLDFLEALEELVPAVYEFHKWEDPLKGM